MTHKVVWLMMLPLIGITAIGCERKAPAPPAATAPATQASTAPATRPVVVEYVAVLRAANPKLPATQPLVVPVDLNDAGHYRLTSPVHLDLRGDLWFTHPDAPPLEKLLADLNVADQQTHVVARPVAFAVWSPGEKGKWFPRLIVRDDAAGTLEWRWQDQRHPLPVDRGYRWTEAILLADGSVAVPGARGVSIFTFEPKYAENYHELGAGADADVSSATTQTATSLPDASRETDAPRAAPTFVAGGASPGASASGYQRASEQAALTPGASSATTTRSSAPPVSASTRTSTKRPSPTDPNPPQILLDPRGLLAWSPWDGKRPGGNGAARFVDGKWQQLGPSDAWPAKILHLVPLLDGSVLQLVRNDDNTVRVAMSTLDASTAADGGTGVDEKTITALVDQLSDDDAKKREAAFNELTRYGTASWPVLEKLAADQPPEARMRIETLLRDRLQPTLGGRVPVDGKIDVAGRVESGGILLFLRSGVTIPRDDGTAAIVRPAWVSIRPGRAIEMLEPVLIRDARPGEQQFFAFGDEWVVSDPTNGPRRLYGNHLEAMLAKPESTYTHVVGQDSRGRWLFRKSDDVDGDTMLLDPTLPDPTPRLPVWLMKIGGGKVGWNRAGYPAINRGGKNHTWILHDTGWRPLDEKTDAFFTELPAAAPEAAAGGIATTRAIATTAATGTASATRAVATTLPSTSPTTAQATTAGAIGADATAAATQPHDAPILVDSDGRKYYDGRATLRAVERGGKETTWKLPDKAAGEQDADVTLLRTPDGALFLFNAPGRAVRIKPTTDAVEPFVVEAVFVDRIPYPDVQTRLWLDPAGRIVMAYDKERLAVMFSAGRVPRDIHTLIPMNELDDPR